MVALRANPRKIYPRFLFAVLRSSAIQDQIERLHVGTLIPHFKKGDFDKLLLPVPDHGTQQFIGDIYFTMSRRIELNRRINDTLEAMARALFKSWFVDFGPVHAKAEGRDLGLPKHLADLFPARLVDSELGEIPEGWMVGTLADVAQQLRRGIQPDQIDPGTPYIALEHMPRRCIALSEWGVANGLESNKFQFQANEILFGKLRPYFHKVGVAPVDGVCSTDIVVVAPKSEPWFGFVLEHVSSDEFVEHTDASSTGTKMPRTSWPDMARYPIITPPEAVARAFTARIRPAIARIVAGLHESHTLAALRDALLPELISGELRLREAETLIERVA
jgi:type I restriction enzyme S subunit